MAVVVSLDSEDTLEKTEFPEVASDWEIWRYQSRYWHFVLQNDDGFSLSHAPNKLSEPCLCLVQRDGGHRCLLG